ncbi:MAG TPA: inosine/xanthosine triphosphatase [Bryobacterales bacterium]|jgi:inosine/xanthosine triphosphatase|nr:inosine/xanthosine triphosphatase [Bryobacterales bacterium]
MFVAVGTAREPKVQAVRAALAEIDPRRRWRIETFPVESGVRETPLHTGETRRGARLRVERLIEHFSPHNCRPDLYIGMEGGIASAGGQVWLENWVYASDGQRGYFGSGGALPLPPAIVEEVLHKGRSLADVIDEIAGRNEIRSQEGTWGVLTRNLITRQHVFRDALVNALTPFLLSPSLFRE